MFLKIRRMQFWQAGQTVTAQLPEMIRKKINEIANYLKKNFFKMFPWRGRKQLESPAGFFFDSQPNFYRSIFKKITNCKFSKRFSPEVSFENENPVLMKTPRFCLQNHDNFSLKVRKRLEEKLFRKKVSQKFFFGPAKIFLITRRNFSDKVAKKIRLLSENNGKVYVLENISLL